MTEQMVRGGDHWKCVGCRTQEVEEAKTGGFEDEPKEGGDVQGEV